MLRSKQRVVLVEDNPGDAFLAWQRLTEVHQGTVQVDVVPSLAETLALLAAGPVDAIVLDLSLPDSQGLATLRRVRAAAGQASIIVVTDNVDLSLREQALAAGAEDVYDKADTHSALFSRSVLYVVERNRAHAQHARLRVLLETMPYAVVIADDVGAVRFANPAALALLGCTDAALLAAHIDFSAVDGPAVNLTVQHGNSSHRCEVQVVSIEWEGHAARLASVIPLPSGTAASEPPSTRAQDSAADLQVEKASHLRSEILASMSQQISHQMHAVTGLSEALERPGVEPLQSCYSRRFPPGKPSLLAALQALVQASIHAGPVGQT